MTGAFGPFAADLQADDRPARPGPAGAATPIPPGSVGPAATPDVEHTPRAAVHFFERDRTATDRERTGHGSRLVLGRVLKTRLGPRNDHVETLVTIRHVHGGIEPARPPVGFAPTRRDPRRAVGFVDDRQM